MTNPARAGEPASCCSGFCLRSCPARLSTADRGGGPEFVAVSDAAIMRATTVHVPVEIVPTDAILSPLRRDHTNGPPTRIGPFRILRKLGAGGMGTVYEAEHESFRRRVALKVLSVPRGSAEIRRRFRCEMQLLGRLQHPGIAQLYESRFSDTDDCEEPFFAMELVDGPPITEYARRHRLTTGQRLELVARLCDAVHYAHRSGVVHQDLKPSNILVTRDGQPKVLDFGIARSREAGRTDAALPQTVQLVGTPAYMSPEQSCGECTDVDGRSDVFSVGVILYELLTGHMPHNLSNKCLAAALRMIQQEEPPLLGTFNLAWCGHLETIVETALQKDPARRYRSMAELGADVRRYLRLAQEATH